jgi:RND family efflux transporter MFP subunit
MSAQLFFATAPVAASHTREPMSHRLNVRLILPLLAAPAAAGCAAQAPPPAAGPPPISATTGNVKRGPISTYATFDGQITPVYQTTLSTAEAGTVEAVDVTEGDFVRKGQVLASLDTSQLQASLRANQATVREDEAQLAHSDVAAPVNAQQYSSAVVSARQNLAAAVNAVRTARAALASDDLTQKADLELLRQQYVSRQTYEQARAAYVSSRETLRSDEQTVTAQQAALRTALSNTNQRLEDQATIAQNQAGLDAARANVDLLQAQIAQSSIVAPFDGQITQRLLDAGAYAGASAGVFALAQLSRVYVVANVPDVDLPTVTRGKSVTFTTVSLPGRTFHGQVFDVNLTPTSGTLSYRVRVLQPNPDLALRGGMLVSMTAVRAHHADVLLVPSSAVVHATSGDSVFTVDGGKAKSVPVHVGLQTDALAEVAGSGLAPGTRVLTSQPNGLRDGSVIAQPGPPPAGAGSK